MIVQPGTGWAVRLAADPQRITRRGTFVAVALIVFLVVGVSLMVGHALVGRIVGVLMTVGALLWVWSAVSQATRRTVGSASWKYKGTVIEGEARALLAGAVVRADQAEQIASEVPGLEWTRMRPHVEAVLWRAAGSAAEASAIGARVAAMGVVDEDSDAARQREELIAERDAHLEIVANARDELVELVGVARRTADNGNGAPARAVSRPASPAPRERRSRPLSGRRPKG